MSSDEERRTDEVNMTIILRARDIEAIERLLVGSQAKVWLSEQLDVRYLTHTRVDGVRKTKQSAGVVAYLIFVGRMTSMFETSPHTFHAGQIKNLGKSNDKKRRCLR